MHFDANRATLVGSTEEIDALVAHVSEHGADSPTEEWVEGGLANQSAAEADQVVLNPTVLGIAEVLGNPKRSVVIERFDGQLVVLSFVAFDESGRTTITEGLGPDELAIIATELTLLPGLLAQQVRLGASQSKDVNREALNTTAGVIESIFTGETPEGSDELGDVLNSFSHAWRASGSWLGAPTDASLTVLDTGAAGRWVAVPESKEQTDETTKVELRQADRGEIMKLLGDVVTGRNQ